MKRRVFLFGVMLLPASLTWAAPDALEAYRRWFQGVANERSRIAATARRVGSTGTGEQKLRGASRVEQLLAAFTRKCKRTKPPVPRACAELDRLLEAALQQEGSYLSSASMYGLNLREYGRDPSLIESIRAEQRALEGLAREYARVFPKRKDSPGTATLIPLR